MDFYEKKGGRGFEEVAGGFSGKGEVSWRNRVFGDCWLKVRFSGDVCPKIEVLVKNRGFFEKWGFRGILVKKSGKSRKEPGI